MPYLIQCRHLQTFLLLPTFLLLLWQSIATLPFVPPASSSGVSATHSRTHSQRAGPGISRLPSCRGRVQRVAAPCPAPGCRPLAAKLIPAALASTQLSCSCCWPSSTPPDSLSSVLSSGADGEHGTTQAKTQANGCSVCSDLTLMVARRLFPRPHSDAKLTQSGREDTGVADKVMLPIQAQGPSHVFAPIRWCPGADSTPARPLG